jgi:ferredoxin-NADP reductase
MLTDVLSRLPIHPQCFVCGPNQLVEQVANTLVDLGLPSDNIRTERFGPT